MDVNCTFNDGQKADIELQLTTAGDNQKLRALYYASKLYAGSLREGMLYKNSPNVYQILGVGLPPVNRPCKGGLLERPSRKPGAGARGRS